MFADNPPSYNVILYQDLQKEYNGFTQDQFDSLISLGLQTKDEFNQFLRNRYFKEKIDSVIELCKKANVNPIKYFITEYEKDKDKVEFFINNSKKIIVLLEKGLEIIKLIELYNYTPDDVKLLVDKVSIIASKSSIPYEIKCVINKFLENKFAHIPTPDIKQCINKYIERVEESNKNITNVYDIPKIVVTQESSS